MAPLFFAHKRAAEFACLPVSVWMWGKFSSEVQVEEFLDERAGPRTFDSHLNRHVKAPITGGTEIECLAIFEPG